MSGTVDQINGEEAAVELIAKDGHAHTTAFPVWLFPCKVVEGTRFTISLNTKSSSIFCENK